MNTFLFKLNKYFRKNSKTILLTSSCLLAGLVGSGYYIAERPLHAAQEQSTVELEDDEKKKRCSQLIKQFKEKNGVPGITVGVSKNGNLIYAKGFGYSDVENCVRADAKTIIRIASISKPITCLVGAKLYENGQLDLDVPIYTYLPDLPKFKFKNADKTITTRQLMAHTSGIRHYKAAEMENCAGAQMQSMHSSKSYKDTSCSEFYMSKNFKTSREALEIFINDELSFQPGTSFLYSTFGYTMLGAVYEKASNDVSFQKQLIEFFRKLDLNETYLDLHDQLIPYRSKYYLRDEKKRLVNVPYVDNSYKWGGGGILSNVTDLCKLGNKLIYYYQSSDTVDEKKFLKASTMRSQVWSTQSKPERSADREVFFEHDYDVTYGLGWNLCFDRNRDLKYVYHTGGAVGATSCLLIAPNNKSNYNEKTDTHTPNGVCVAVLCNSQDVGDIVKFSYLISKIFADESNEY